MTNQTQSDSPWPLPKFFFQVILGSPGTAVSFQEVSGLDTEPPAVEYRAGNSGVFAPIKMPGLAKVSSVTLRKGTFANDDNFWQWYEAIQANTSKREDVTIQLLDETGNPVMTWTLRNAWPYAMRAFGRRKRRAR